MNDLNKINAEIANLEMEINSDARTKAAVA